MKRRLGALSGFILAMGIFSAAPVEIAANADVCSVGGYTVVYINGVFTDYNKAKTDEEKIIGEFLTRQPHFVDEVEARLAYNATHLGGLGDLFKSIQQKMWETEGQTKEDFDLLTIARQLQQDVKTQRILIIGHSQGTFYANALYDYLIRRGVRPEALAVYNIATPASYVAGHGKYLTNENDKVIEGVRRDAAAFGYPAPLPANTMIEPKSGDEGNEWAGHGIADVYLDARPTDIAGTMSFLLSRLEADPTRDSGQPCIPPQGGSVAYIVKKIAFGMTDPLAGAAKPALAVAHTIGSGVAGPLFTAGGALVNAFSNMFAGERNAQHAAAVEAYGALEDGNNGDETSSVSGIIYDTSGGVGEAEGEAGGQVLGVAVSGGEGGGTSAASPTPQGAEIITSPQSSAPAPSAAPTPPPTNSPSQNMQLSLGYVAGDGAWGGGGGGGGGAVVTNAVAEDEPDPAPEPEPEAEPAAALSVSSPAGDLVTKEMEITLSGAADASATTTISIDGAATTTAADGSGNWSLAITLTEGAHALTFTAENAAGATSTAIVRSVTVDLTPPSAPTLSVAECTYSLSADDCFIPETNVNVTWSAALGAASYALFLGDVEQGTTTATSFAMALPDNATSTLSAIAYDDAGNASATSTTVTVVVMSQPVIINEVAWAGTTANSEDEWVELKNLSGYDIDMTKLSLSAEDGAPEITLDGTLAAANTTNNSDIYLIERHTGVTTADDSRHTLFEQLADSGEELRLIHRLGEATVTVDTTPAVSICSGWCAGSLPVAVHYSPEKGEVLAAVSMERIAGSADGSLLSAWRSNDTYTKSASDASGNSVYGTPARENSSGLPSAGFYCSPDTEPIDSGSIYTPTGEACTYLSAFMHPDAARWGAVFKGELGNAEDKFSHFIGKTSSKEESFAGGITGSSGDEFFAAIFEAQTFGTDLGDFMNWFKYGTTTTGSISPPHTNYRIIEWTLGE